MTSAVATATEIRPFRVDVPREHLDDLRWEEPEIFSAELRAAFESVRW